jgi:TctA family transporter
VAAVYAEAEAEADPSLLYAGTVHTLPTICIYTVHTLHTVHTVHNVQILLTLCIYGYSIHKLNIKLSVLVLYTVLCMYIIHTLYMYKLYRHHILYNCIL